MQQELSSLHLVLEQSSSEHERQMEALAGDKERLETERTRCACVCVCVCVYVRACMRVCVVRTHYINYFRLEEQLEAQKEQVSSLPKREDMNRYVSPPPPPDLSQADWPALPTDWSFSCPPWRGSCRRSNRQWRRWTESCRRFGPSLRSVPNQRI